MPVFPHLRLWYYLPWSIAMVLAVLAFILPPEAVSRLGPWLFLSSFLFLGIPHGAADISLARILLPRRFYPIPFFAGYLVVVVGILFLWPLSPSLFLAGFILLTMWHWGSAEVYPLQGNGDRLKLMSAHSWLRGGWVLLAPFATHHEQTMILLKDWGMPLNSIPPLEILFGFWLVCVAGELILATIRFPQRQALPVWSEVLLLALVAFILPPLWWISLYFLFFHSWRHTLRIEHSFGQSIKSGQLNRGLLGLATMRFAPIVALTLCIFIGFFWLQPMDFQHDARGWAGAFVVLLAALTVPHSILVRIWDLKTLTRGPG